MRQLLISFSIENFFRLFQVEYAIEAVKLGSTAVGIQTRGGIILGVEKRLTSPLLEPSSVEKILELDFHIGVAVSGLIGGKRISCTTVLEIKKNDVDARTLVDHARIEAQNHRFTFDEVKERSYQNLVFYHII